MKIKSNFANVIAIFCLISLLACNPVDESKISEPSDYQIKAINLGVTKGIRTTNMAAQKYESNYTLVGASLKLQDGDEKIGVWIFDNNDSTFIKAVDEEAEEYSMFPKLDEFEVKSEARNVKNYLKK